MASAAPADGLAAADDIEIIWHRFALKGPHTLAPRAFGSAWYHRDVAVDAIGGEYQLGAKRYSVKKADQVALDKLSCRDISILAASPDFALKDAVCGSVHEVNVTGTSEWILLANGAAPSPLGAATSWSAKDLPIPRDGEAAWGVYVLKTSEGDGAGSWYPLDPGVAEVGKRAAPPPACLGAATSVDSSKRRIFFFGGVAGIVPDSESAGSLRRVKLPRQASYLSDVGYLSFSDADLTVGKVRQPQWKSFQSNSTDVLGTWPPPRAFASAVTVGKNCIYHGGINEGGILADIHVLNSAKQLAWSQPELGGSAALLARFCHVAVPLSAGAGFLLFGGCGPGPDVGKTRSRDAPRGDGPLLHVQRVRLSKANETATISDVPAPWGKDFCSADREAPHASIIPSPRFAFQWANLPRDAMAGELLRVCTANLHDIQSAAAAKASGGASASAGPALKRARSASGKGALDAAASAAIDASDFFFFFGGVGPAVNESLGRRSTPRGPIAVLDDGCYVLQAVPRTALPPLPVAAPAPAPAAVVSEPPRKSASSAAAAPTAASAALPPRAPVVVPRAGRATRGTSLLLMAAAGMGEAEESGEDLPGPVRRRQKQTAAAIETPVQGSRSRSMGVSTSGLQAEGRDADSTAQGMTSASRHNLLAGGTAVSAASAERRALRDQVVGLMDRLLEPSSFEAQSIAAPPPSNPFMQPTTAASAGQLTSLNSTLATLATDVRTVAGIDFGGTVRSVVRETVSRTEVESLKKESSEALELLRMLTERMDSSIRASNNFSAEVRAFMQESQRQLNSRAHADETLRNAKSETERLLEQLQVERAKTIRAAASATSATERAAGLEAKVNILQQRIEAEQAKTEAVERKLQRVKDTMSGG